MANPRVRCSEETLSPTKALKGSIEMLIDASITHNMPAAIHSAGELGIKTSAIDANMAPARKYGLLRPRRVHVLSL